MKINKITAIVCGVLTFLTGVGTVLMVLFAPQTTEYAAIQGILSSIFSGFIVSLVVPTIGYFHERAVIIERTDSSIQSLYINLYITSHEIGKTLSQIPSAARMETLPFKYIGEQSALNIDFIKDMDLNLFIPFFKQGKWSRVYNKLREFRGEIYNIKNISSSLYGQSMEYDIQFLTMQNNLIKGIPVAPTSNMALEELKNTINVRTAKFHEYATSQLLELEKIAEDFYSTKGKKQSWKDIKPVLLQQIETIMRR